MNGKIVGAFIVGIALVAAASIYWLQVYAFYSPVPASAEAAKIRLVALDSAAPEEIAVSGFDGIDADSSPLRFRACFQVENSLAMLTETYQMAGDVTPLNGPGWFSCYDAARIGEDLKSGQALAFISEPEIRPGIRRVVAVYEDGRGYAWHEVIPE